MSEAGAAMLDELRDMCQNLRLRACVLRVRITIADDCCVLLTIPTRSVLMTQNIYVQHVSWMAGIRLECLVKHGLQWLFPHQDRPIDNEAQWGGLVGFH